MEEGKGGRRLEYFNWQAPVFVESRKYSENIICPT